MSNRHIIKVAILILLLYIVSGCDNTGPNSIGQIELTISIEDEGRTILPEISSFIHSYRIDFEGPYSKPSINTTDSSSTINIAEGLWNITVNGLNETEKVVAEDSVSNLEINAGEKKKVQFYLEPLTQGNGGINIEITWPDGQQVDDTSKIEFDGRTYGMGGEYPETTFNVETRTICFNKSVVASGSYALIADLNFENNDKILVPLSIHVYDNIITPALVELTSDDFTQPPVPSILSPLKEGNNSITVRWQNSSSVIIEYQLERSTTEESGYSVIHTTEDGTILQFEDTSVTVGTTYFYRIIAVSAGGSSEPSNIENIAVEPPQPGNEGILTLSNTTDNSTKLLWTQATDNITSQTLLEYRVVYSESDILDTVSDAENTGTIAVDWTNSIEAAEITGLTSGTTYYFNVLVRDEAGNIGIYNTTSETPANSNLDINITIEQPEEEDVNFSKTQDFTVPQDSTIILTIDDTYDSFVWYLDGVKIDEQNIYSFQYECNTIAPGVHHLTVFVTKNDLLYSNSIRFIVTN